MCILIEDLEASFTGKQYNFENEWMSTFLMDVKDLDGKVSQTTIYLGAVYPQ